MTLEQTPPETRKAGARFILWVALGTALMVTVVSATVMATGPRLVGIRQGLRSLGLSAQEAGRAEASVTHEFHVEMLWTAVLAAALLVCWVVATRYLRAHRAPLAPQSRKGRLGLGVLLGILGYGFVAPDHDAGVSDRTCRAGVVLTDASNPATIPRVCR